MTRELLDSASRAQVSSQVVREVIFVRIPFSGGTLAVSTADKDFTFTPAGEGTPVTFLHGALGGIDNFNENMDLRAERFSITLGGCDSSLISKVSTTAIHWLRTQIWFGYLDASGNLVTSPPFLIGDGFLGSATLNTAGNGSSIIITVETLNAALARVSQVRGCDADQQIRFGTDTFFHQVSVQGVRAVAFGNRRQTISGDGPGGTGTIGVVQPPISPPPLFPGVPTEIV